MLVLGEAGLRCEELATLERRDFLPARKGAKLRVLDVRHGKGDRQRRVSLSAAASRAIVRWDRERTRALSEPGPGDALFITLGRRRRDGSYARPGGRCGQEVVSDVLKRLGAAAELPQELRHPHALRHTCATELLKAGATIADVRVSSATPQSRRRRFIWPLARTARNTSCSCANASAPRLTTTATRHSARRSS